MIDALYNSLSGLNTFQKALNVQSNNIANVDTPSFKSDRLNFADMMYQNGIGKGTQGVNVQKTFAQGSLKATHNQFDVGLNGDGFFVVENPRGRADYTRAGNFRRGVNGNLQTADYRNILGLSTKAVPKKIISSDANAKVFDGTYVNNIASEEIDGTNAFTSINAKATDYKASAKDDVATLHGNGYKTRGRKISDTDKLRADYSQALSTFSRNPNVASKASVAQVDTIDIDPSTIDKTSILRVTIGNQIVSQKFDTSPEKTLQDFADKISSISAMSASVDTKTGKLTITGLEPGVEHKIFDASLNLTKNLAIKEVKKAVVGSGALGLEAYAKALKTSIEKAGGKFLQITNGVKNIADGGALPTLDTMDLNLKDLKLSSEGAGKMSIGKNGLITIDQQGSKFVVGKIELATFRDNLSLRAMGNNLYAKTAKSGPPSLALKGSVTMENKYLEMSNTSLATGLTDLMVYQRSFEANAKALTTSDDFLNTAIRLKR